MERLIQKEKTYWQLNKHQTSSPNIGTNLINV